VTDWKNIFIPLITVVLSSSIIGTILNSTYQDFAESITKPVFDFGGSSTHDVTTGIIDLSIRITNNGNEDAQNPIITIKLVDKVKLIGIPKVESYLHGNIIVDANDTSTFSYNLENDTINQGEMIEIQAKLKESEVSSFYYYSSGLDYISNIKVRYDNGFASLSDSQYRNEEFISYTLFTILPFIILGLSISIPFVYLKKLSRLGNNKNYEFKINIANLLLKMYDSIRNNTSSKKIFDFKFWNEEYSETKRKIFDSYTDYNILNN